MKKIIFILFTFVAFSVKAQNYDTTIALSETQLANLYKQPVMLLSPPPGYTNYITSVVGYFKAGDTPYTPVSLMIGYVQCAFFIANFSQLLSMKKDTYIYNSLNSIPDKCYQSSPLIIYSNGVTGNGNGTLKLILTYIKIEN